MHCENKGGILSVSGMFLIFILVLTLMTGCGKTPEESGASQTDPSETAAATAEESTGMQDTAEETETKETENAELVPDEKGVYTILTAAGVRNMVEHPDASFVLGADIDLGGEVFAPIGTEEKPFSGKLDGKEHTLSNFRVQSDSGLLGLFGVVTGRISKLNVTDMTLVTSGKKQSVGALAAVLRGADIENCNVTAVLDAAAAPADGSVLGQLAGTAEDGFAAKNEVRMDIRLQSDSGRYTVGGLTGSSKGGEMDVCKALGRLILSGSAEWTCGLICGANEGMLFDRCQFMGAMNSLNGSFFNALSGSGNASLTESCLWRDNTHSDDLLTEKNRSLRQITIDYMYAMGTVQWSTDRKLTYQNADYDFQMFLPGIVYNGLPYTGASGSLERFNYCFNEDGSLLSRLGDTGFGGFDIYMGNDCSGALLWAWARITPGVDAYLTDNMMPSAKNGTIALGDIPRVNEVGDTSTLYSETEAETVYEAYAFLHMGDATLYYKPGIGGHTHLIVENYTMRDVNGRIDPEASYCVSHGQGEGIDTVKKRSSWSLYREQTYDYMWNHEYFIPITCKDLSNEEIPAVVWSQSGPKSGYDALEDGKIECNYRIISVKENIYDASGSCIWEETQFAGSDTCRGDYKNVKLRGPIRIFDMSLFRDKLKDAGLQVGKEYHATVTLMPATGEEIIVRDVNFKY